MSDDQDFRKRFSAMSQDERERLAFSCETSVGHLRNVAFSGKPCGYSLAVRLEKALGIPRWKSRPNDWHEVWPDLIGSKGAPPVLAPAVAASQAAQPSTTSKAGHAAG